MLTFKEALLSTMTKEQLADEVVRLAKQNVKLKDEISRLEHENFWVKVKERENRSSQEKGG